MERPGLNEALPSCYAAQYKRRLNQTNNSFIFYYYYMIIISLLNLVTIVITVVELGLYHIVIYIAHYICIH